MGIPQFRSEGVDQGAANNGAFTISFAAFTWQANDIIEIVFATDGWVPVLTTANGFALAQDPAGNSAGITTNGGTVGTAECGIFVYWKRAVGTTTTTDPPPVFQAPSVSGGTSWCLQPNSFSGARTSGTPYTSITSSIVTTATTAVTSVAASSGLANCLFMPRVASSNDDAAFNNWTMTGSAGPSGTGAPQTGWHNSTGNACAFTGDEGGFAAATSNVTATTTFAASTKQALVTLVMASLPEPTPDEESPYRAYPPPPMQPWRQVMGADELPPQPTAAFDDDRTVALLPPPPIQAIQARTVDDELTTPITLSIGVTAWREKANTTTPNTGTVTTLASYPAWPASTAQQIVNDPRVTNSGNVYELATSGTTASSGGPTGTPAPVTNGAITDGTAKWNFLVTGNGAANTQTNGSMFLVSSGQGSDTNSGTTPTDNMGNTYTKIGATSFFASFPQSSAASYVASLPSTGGTGHTISGTYGLGLDGGGDEKSLMFVEVIGGTSIVDHSQGEFSPNGSNVVTSASVTTTGPAILVCFCWLNGGVQADGFLHQATPGSGFAQLPLASGLLEIGNTAGQVQGTTIWKQVSGAGTYTASITTASDGGTVEGAVMHLIAVQGSAALTIVADEDRPPTVWPQAWPTPPTISLQSQTEELPSPLTPIDDTSAMPQVPPARMLMAPTSISDEDVPTLIAVDDDSLGMSPVAPVLLRVVPAPSDDDAPLLYAVDDDQPAPNIQSPLARRPLAVPTEDDVPTLLAIDDDSPQPAIQAPQVARAAAPPSADDEFPLGAVLTDEDSPAQVQSPRSLTSTVMPAADDEPPIQAVVDEDQQSAQAAPLPRPFAMQLGPDDEVATTSAAAIDDDTPTVQPVPLPPVELLAWQGADELPVTIAASVVDDDQSAPLAMPRAVVQVAQLATDDDAPVQVTPVVEDDTAPPVAQLPRMAALAQADLDELPILVLDDEQTPVTIGPRPAQAISANPASDDVPSAFILDEDSGPPAMPWRMPAMPWWTTDGDELPAPLAPGPLVADDDRPQQYQRPWMVAQPQWSAVEDVLVFGVAPPFTLQPKHVQIVSTAVFLDVSQPITVLLVEVTNG